MSDAEPNEQGDESSVPYVHGRDLVPIRRQPRRHTSAHHEQLFAREDALRARVDEVDTLLVALTEERHGLLDAIRDVHDELRPAWRDPYGRRRRHVSHEEPLPPTAPRPTHVCGRELRAICLALLHRARSALTLRQLHVLLHRTGYAIAHTLPTKALADALGYEADHGRAQRVRRGAYAAERSAADGPDSDKDGDGDEDGDGDTLPSTLPDW